MFLMKQNSIDLIQILVIQCPIRNESVLLFTLQIYWEPIHI